MRKCLITICLMMFMLPSAGCLETLALVGGGAAGGMTITRILDQQQKVIQEDIAMMEAQRADLKQQLAEATTEEQKQKLQQQIKNTETVLLDLKDANEAITRAKEGLGVNWKDPQAVIPFATAILMAFLAELQRRKKNRVTTEKNNLTTALQEVVVGGEILKKYGNAVAVTAFKDAQKTAQQTPETRKLVAAIKAP